MIIRSQWPHDIHMYKGRWLGSTQPTRIIDRWTSIYPETFVSLFSTSICCLVSNSGARLQWWNSGGRGWEVGDLTSSFLILWLFIIQSNIYIPLLINRLDLNCDEMYRSQPLAGNSDTQSDWLQLFIRFANQIQRSHHHSSKSNSSEYSPLQQKPESTTNSLALRLFSSPPWLDPTLVHRVRKRSQLRSFILHPIWPSDTLFQKEPYTEQQILQA